MQTLGVIQCRMASTRLPGKAVLPLAGKTVLEWVILRARRIQHISKLVLAISDKAEDEPLAEIGTKAGISIVRGSSEHVLSRYWEALERNPSDFVLRLTADNPLVDTVNVGQLIQFFTKQQCEYGYAAKLPYGAGADIFQAKALLDLQSQSLSSRNKEHINTFFFDNHLRYRICSFLPEPELQRPDLRVTLDTQEDYDRLQRVFEKLPFPGKAFVEEVIELLTE